MGKEWSHHKYIKKEGKRYYYKTPKAIPSAMDNYGMGDVDLVGASKDLDRFEPIKKFRDTLNQPIWSPNKEDETLITKGEELMVQFFNKNREKETLLAKGGK